jgi:hypothetical protein
MKDLVESFAATPGRTPTLRACRICCRIFSFCFNLLQTLTAAPRDTLAT